MLYFLRHLADKLYPDVWTLTIGLGLGVVEKKQMEISTHLPRVKSSNDRGNVKDLGILGWFLM